ncbi:hypothetical protein SARC_13336 [Sphaeroforma arctica JP610]|uniref:Uncharacterized protein n=1 Tax=Sphaeroforma arctica JP610 TaxID=667725 RepID=A0A0L0FBH6_9EUKA|nr:hypothetical protein SARC_13336 [Sphaeroforma arctica JP610]KNC74107.1 hypothetical protein SARC_13336 [Sphaeroforma arctica JP610]|eukprot:XP_014148009.1 hypothetical protein SARC_13336 [Sphaeroforma arctica JP610]
MILFVLQIPENVPVGSTNEYKRVVALRESDKALFDLSVTIPNADSTASSDTDADKLRADISVKLRMTGVNVIFMNRFVTDISAYGLDFAAAMAKYTEELQQAKTNPHEQSVELKHSSSGGPRPSVSTVPMRDKAQASMQTLTKRNTVSAIKLRRPSTLVDENRLGVQQQGRSKSINNHNAAPGDRRRSSAKLKRRNSSANSDKALRNSLTTTISKVGA